MTPPARKKPGTARRSSPRRSAAHRARPGTALRITRVYTRTGDAGTTRLVGGQEVAKDSARIEAYGTVDELSVSLAAARLELDAAIRETAPPAGRGADPLAQLIPRVAYIQNQLFTLGGDLATRVEDRWAGMPVITAADVTWLEKLIDGYNGALPPLTDFIVPGGARLPVAMHAARVICRRAERRLQTLAAEEPTGGYVLPYVNRLSDLLFVLARWTAARLRDRGLDVAEPVWNRELPRPAPPRPPK